MRTSKHLALLLVVVLCATMFAPLAMADGTRVQPREVVNHRVFSSEEDAGILTDEASARIKRIIQEQGIVDIDTLLEPFFRNCIREDEVIIGNARSASVGDSRYKVTYDNSGIFTYKSKGGIWNAIKSATISTLLGEIKTVGTILSFTYSVIGGYSPNYEAEATAKTQYSYRYIQEAGQVYYNNGSALAYTTRAEVVSRETYQHEYGYYIDTTGKAHSHTRDFSKYAKYEPAPHAGLMTWIKDKAVYQWKNDLPSYYEDWND